MGPSLMGPSLMGPKSDGSKSNQPKSNRPKSNMLVERGLSEDPVCSSAESCPGDQGHAFNRIQSLHGLMILRTQL